jgi:hypothetical protein
LLKTNGLPELPLERRFFRTCAGLGWTTLPTVFRRKLTEYVRASGPHCKGQRPSSVTLNQHLKNRRQDRRRYQSSNPLLLAADRLGQTERRGRCQSTDNHGLQTSPQG